MKNLFGGALTINLPDSFISAETFREIPDNQEVFIQKDSLLSFILELLEFEENQSDPLNFYWHNLAEESSSLYTSELGPVKSFKTENGNVLQISKGIQFLSKFRKENTFDVVQISICLLRLKEHGTDVLMIMNDPIEVDIPIKLFEQKKSQTIYKESPNDLLFSQWTSSFKIQDSSLFNN